MPKFTRRQNFTKSNILGVPINKSIVYKLENKNGTNLYTGVAGRGRVQSRLLEHKELKREIIKGAVKFQIAQFKNKDIAERVEKQIIRKEQPKFNTQNK